MYREVSPSRFRTLRRPREQVGERVALVEGHPESSWPKDMAACLKNIATARAQLGEARSAQPGLDLRRVRADLLAALEAYEAAIGELGAPVPPKLQREIQLYRHLSGRQ